MAVRNILKMGNPFLLRKASPVEDFGSQELKDHIQDLIDTMIETRGIGIAAPQIGIDQRIVIFGFDKSKRYPKEKPLPLTVLINPEIEVLSQTQVEGWEGCLSVPLLRGNVPRYQKIRYSAFSPDGTRFTEEAEDFHARVVQHECDHLDGYLFPFRLQDMAQFGYEDEIYKVLSK